MQTIERNELFELAYRFVTETSENIFLTGKAGTGKTTFLKYLKENSTKNIVVAAPTGVAAINAGGCLSILFYQQKAIKKSCWPGPGSPNNGNNCCVKWNCW